MLMMNRIAFYCFAILLAACNPGKPKEVKKDAVVAETVQQDIITMPEVEGVYKDTLPCADCAGILVTIQLGGDSTYLSEQQYLGKKKDDVFYTLGRWSLKDSIITLGDVNDASDKYKASLNSITMLDKSGHEIADTKHNYTFARIANKNFKTKGNIPVEGMFVYYADTHLFTLCASGKTYPAALVKETVAMERDYTSLKKADKEPMLAHVEGIFEMRKSMDGDKDEVTFVIKKFIKFLPGEKCKQ